MRHTPNQKLALASFFMALGIVLPFLTGQIPEIGSRLLPMHIPVLLCGFFCGWKYGFGVGLLTPIFRSLLFTMPPMYPTAVSMSFELAAYGALTGILYLVLPKKTPFIFVALILAMIGGRIVMGLANTILYSAAGNNYSFKMFITGAFVFALPGIIVQIIIIPIIVRALQQVNPNYVLENN